jgi:DNA polymerase-3 subunit epsilon
MNKWDDVVLEKVPLVVLDTETTGLHPGLGDRVVEVAAVRFEGWQPVETLNRLVCPNRPIHPRAAAISGITDADVQDAPPFADIAAELLALIGDAVLVAHNAPFDAGFVGLELWLAGLYDPAALREPVLPNPWLCTLQLARRHFHFGRNNLQHVAHKLGVRVGRAHRALNDVHMTAEVLKRMSRDFRTSRIATMGDLLWAQGNPVWTPAPPNVPLPDLLAAAIAQRHPLRLHYLGQGPARPLVQPLYAATHEGVPHLIARDVPGNGVSPYRLDQIISAERLPPAATR